MFAFNRTLARKKVIVNLKTDKAIEGICWAQRGSYLVLREAVLHEGNQAAQIDGEAIVDVSNVDFYQVVT